MVWAQAAWSPPRARGGRPGRAKRNRCQTGALPAKGSLGADTRGRPGERSLARRSVRRRDPSRPLSRCRQGDGGPEAPSLALLQLPQAFPGLGVGCGPALPGPGRLPPRASGSPHPPSRGLGGWRGALPLTAARRARERGDGERRTSEAWTVMATCAGHSTPNSTAGGGDTERRQPEATACARRPTRVFLDQPPRRRRIGGPAPREPAPWGAARGSRSGPGLGSLGACRRHGALPGRLTLACSLAGPVKAAVPTGALSGPGPDSLEGAPRCRRHGADDTRPPTERTARLCRSARAGPCGRRLCRHDGSQHNSKKLIDPCGSIGSDNTRPPTTRRCRQDGSGLASSESRLRP